MNTLKQTLSDYSDESFPQIEEKITGFDCGTRPIFKEPSLYLSVFVVFIATFACLGKTPAIFGCAFVALSAMTVAFHAMAERIVFRANKDYQPFAAPFEGAFVLTLGSILPGIVLLAYGVDALIKSVQPNLPEELGKLALLLLVPFFNFIVWKSVRKGYLIRPRIIGLMNGLALGLSASWTIIWMKSLMVPQGFTSCKFGWMMLLCVSPFMLLAAATLNWDLWRKTESGIGKVATTFAVLGGLLSMLFVFTPVVRSSFVQSLLMQAKQGPENDRTKAISTLRSIATPEDLRPVKHPISGFALASLLVSDRGLDTGTDQDKDVFFRITGQPFEDLSVESDANSSLLSSSVGENIPGLSLANSNISGRLDASTLSSSVDWTLGFHNSTSSSQEARAEIRIPDGAVVSRVTLWVNGEERPGIISPTFSAGRVYASENTSTRAPLLVTMPVANRILVRCFPIPACGGGTKMHIAFKIPLETADGKICSMELPKLISSNFAQRKRHRINLQSRDVLVQNTSALVAGKNASGFTLSGIIKPNTDEINSVVVRRNTKVSDTAVIDPRSAEKRYIVSQFREIGTPAAASLSVVVDCSSALKNEVPRIKEILAALPDRLKPTVYFAAEREATDDIKTEISGMSLKEAQKALSSEAFFGGQNNHEIIREVLERTAEQPHGGVLWIHGPQPTTQNLSESNAIDLVNPVRLYDLQFGSGANNSVLSAIKSEDISSLISCQSLRGELTANVNDLEKLVAGLETATKKFTVQRKIVADSTPISIIGDRLSSEQVAALWAGQQVTTLIENGGKVAALKVAEKYGILSEVSGAVVVDSDRDLVAFKRNPERFVEELNNLNSNSSSYSHAPGLVGAPIDPRYGQSNEVGYLADFGYDTARDISRMMTALAFLISIGIAISSIRSRKELGSVEVGKAVAIMLLVPTAVHLVGTFMINNYGGLGGGL